MKLSLYRLKIIICFLCFFIPMLPFPLPFSFEIDPKERAMESIEMQPFHGNINKWDKLQKPHLKTLLVDKLDFSPAFDVGRCRKRHGSLEAWLRPPV